jgi:lysine-specific demethylase/histidyl-hydroxylase NO66
VDAGERLVVLAGDRRLEMPARIRPAMEVVVLFKEFSPADLGENGGLDKESRLVLCRRLLRDGVLEVVG